MAIGVEIPQVGDTPSQYVEKVSNSFTAIDAHDHTDDPVKELHSDAADSASLEINSGAIRVKDGGITPAKLHPSFGGFVPAGTIIAYAANLSGNPSGYLRCDGATYNFDDYPTLGALLGNRIGGTGIAGGTFLVPDLRGQFLRGRDTGTTIDPDSASRTYNGGGPGGVIGSFQTSQYQSHNHTTADFASLRGTTSADTAGPGPNNQGPGDLSFTVNAQNSVTESRPKNVYVEYIIKT